MDLIEANKIEEGFKKEIDFYEIEWYINEPSLMR